MLLTILTFIIILGFLVLAHELGHFVTARIFKTGVEEFAIGMGPSLVSVYRDEETQKLKWVWFKKNVVEQTGSTVYAIKIVPIGGYVRIKGENAAEIKEEDSFGAKKIWQRAVILSAGVFMNVVVCAVLLAVVFGAGFPATLDNEVVGNAKLITDKKIQVVSINKNSPAAMADMKVGDVLLSLDGQSIENIPYLQNYVSEHENEMVNLVVSRADEEVSLEVTPAVLETSNQTAVLGIGLVETGIVHYTWYQSIWQGIKSTYQLAIAMFVALGGILKSIFATGEMAAQIAGPVGIVFITDQMVGLGFVYVLQFAALLSLNLALINILPFPALDGGRLVFLLIEKIRGKEVNQRIENIVHTVGFVFLMLLVVFVTYKDLVRWGGELIDRVF